MKSKRVAIIHDWLITIGGAERVLKEILSLLPQADIYTMIDTLSNSKNPPIWLTKHKIYTSPLNRLPFIKKYYQKLIYIMPNIVEMFDLSKYDLIISSSHAISKGVITHPHQTHIAYIYTPMRYAWDLMYEYDSLNAFNKGLKRIFTLKRLHNLRVWDVISSNRADKIVAISKFISHRIKKTWGKDSIIIYPPVDTSFSCVVGETHPTDMGGNSCAVGGIHHTDMGGIHHTCRVGPAHHLKDDYYITASRLVEYKRVDIIIEAFKHLPTKKLIIIGEGAKLKTLKKLAAKNIIFKQIKNDKEKLEYFSKAKAFIFMAKEDFGITPIEANSCGVPVIAYQGGAISETMQNIDSKNPSALFVKEQSAQSLIKAIEHFEQNQEKFTKQNCINNAKRFSTKIFKKNFQTLLENSISNSKVETLVPPNISHNKSKDIK